MTQLLGNTADNAVITPRAVVRSPAADKVVGLLFNGIPEQQRNELFFGATVATQSFQTAMFRYGTMDRYELFAQPSRGAGAQEQVDRITDYVRIGPKRINVHECSDLTKSFDSYGFSVWHDAGAVFMPLFHLRSTLARTLFPITFTHHTISYAEMLHGYHLRLLLADTHPFDSVICTTPAARTAFMRLVQYVAESFNQAFGTQLAYRGRFDVIPLGVDTDIFRPRDKEDMRRQMDLPLDAFIILWLGRFSATDKMDLLPLLRVFRRLVDDNPSRKLLFVLAGKERHDYGTAVNDYARSLNLQKSVLVRRNVPQNTQHLLHAAADVFVSPSDNIQECFGLTPIEAMASGVPQVVADWDGYRHTVRHGETGFLVPTYWGRCDGDLQATAALYPFEFDHLSLAQSVVVDPGKYRHYLQLLISNDDLRMQMARQSRQRAVALYSWHTVIGQYEALWKELGEEAARHPFSPKPNADYLKPPYFDTFGHYATALIPDEALLRLTSDGQKILRGKEPFPKFPGLSACLNENLLKQVMVAIKVADRLGRGYRFTDLVHDLAKSQSSHPDLVRRHVLWLMKYGLAEPTDGFPGDTLKGVAP
jgi:D-inositol-3-phosphate glycosyltransferase